MNILVCLFSVCLFFRLFVCFFGIHSGPGPFFGHHTIEVRRKGYFFSYSSLDSGLGFNGFRYRYIVESRDLCFFVCSDFFFFRGGGGFWQVIVFVFNSALLFYTLIQFDTLLELEKKYFEPNSVRYIVCILVYQ